MSESSNIETTSLSSTNSDTNTSTHAIPTIRTESGPVDLIPCEICNDSVPFNDYSEHITRCRFMPTLLTPQDLTSQLFTLNVPIRIHQPNNPIYNGLTNSDSSFYPTLVTRNISTGTDSEIGDTRSDTDEHSSYSRIMESLNHLINRRNRIPTDTPADTPQDSPQDTPQDSPQDSPQDEIPTDETTSVTTDIDNIPPMRDRRNAMSYHNARLFGEYRGEMSTNGIYFLGLSNPGQVWGPSVDLGALPLDS